MIDYRKIVSITPYKELRGGKESIYAHIKDGYVVPNKVIVYLQTTEPFVMSPGIYEHPFKAGTRLLGPYLFTDGKYCWDRDAWKYVVKYGLVLPQEFIDHVMSDEGTAFLEKCAKGHNSLGKIIEKWKEQPNSICLLPENAGNIDLEDF